MEGISIMPGSIRPVSANCAAAIELKGAMRYKGEGERGRKGEIQKETRENQRCGGRGEKEPPRIIVMVGR